MGLVITAVRGDKDGVTLAQMSDAVERATRECIEHGIDPHTVYPRTLNRFGGKINKISIEV